MGCQDGQAQRTLRRQVRFPGRRGCLKAEFPVLANEMALGLDSRSTPVGTLSRAEESGLSWGGPGGLLSYCRTRALSPTVWSVGSCYEPASGRTRKSLVGESWKPLIVPVATTARTWNGSVGCKHRRRRHGIHLGVHGWTRPLSPVEGQASGQKTSHGPVYQ